MKLLHIYVTLLVYYPPPPAHPYLACSPSLQIAGLRLPQTVSHPTTRGCEKFLPPASYGTLKGASTSKLFFEKFVLVKHVLLCSKCREKRVEEVCWWRKKIPLKKIFGPFFLKFQWTEISKIFQKICSLKTCFIGFKMSRKTRGRSLLMTKKNFLWKNFWAIFAEISVDRNIDDFSKNLFS